MLLTDRYDTFLIDWDGTLANTVDMWLDLLVETYAEYGKSPDRSTLMEKAFGNWNSPKEFGIDNVDKFNDELFAKADKNMSLAPLFPTSRQLLDELQNLGKTIVLITSNARKVIDPALDHHDLNDLFKITITADDVEHHKPDPEPIYKALAETKSSKDASVMIGDSSSDVLAGKAAGVGTVLIYPDEHHQIYSEEYISALHADVVLKTPAEVLSHSRPDSR